MKAGGRGGKGAAGRVDTAVYRGFLCISRHDRLMST